MDFKKYNKNNINLPFTEYEYNQYLYDIDSNFFTNDGKIIDRENITYNGDKYYKKIPTTYDCFNVFKHLYDINNDFKFYDLGCGVGSVLYFLKKIGYKNPTGVEMNLDLKKYHNDLDVIYGDLLELDLSFLRDANIIYLYRPIKDEILSSKLIDNILLNTKPGTIILYGLPDNKSKEKGFKYIDNFYFYSDMYYKITS